MRLSAFFADIGKSCYDMERYREYRARPWQEAARYCAAFLGALSLVAGLAFAAYAAPMPGRLSAHLRGALPDDASFTVSGGTLATTVEGRLSAGTDALPFVIDTSVDGTSSAGPDAPDEGFLLGRDAVFFMEDGEIASVQSFKTFPDTTLTKSDILSLLDANGILLVGAASVAFALAHLFILSFNVALFVALTAWLSFAIGKMRGLSLGYDRWVAVGLHAVTLPVIVDHLFWGLSSPVAFAFPILYFMIVIAVIVDEGQSPVKVHPKT